MSTETKGHHSELQYGEDKMFREVLSWLNDTDEGRERYLAGALLSEAEGLLEILEQDYLEADGIIEMGPTQPQANDFTQKPDTGISSNTQRVGQALSALAEMPDYITEFDYLGDPDEDIGSTRYDMTSANYESLCGAVEAVTNIQDEHIKWQSYNED